MTEDASKTTDVVITPTTATTTTTSSPKPGWQTSEFYMKLGAILLTALFASGVIPTSGPAATIAAIAATMLGAIGYTVSRSIVKAAAFLLFIALSTQSMACGASAREKTISATFAATHVAAVGFDAYADKHEGEIIQSASSADDGRSKLVAWRAKVDKVEKDIDAIYTLVQVAALLKDDQTVATLIQAALVFQAELKDLGVLK
jgi:hypothetical protein